MGNVNPKAKCEKIEGGYRIEITGIDIKGESWRDRDAQQRTKKKRPTKK